MRLTFGPGALVAAAFIGPGTVTACTLAGANFGYALLWALLFATLATIVLQEMAARLGAGAGLGLGEALMQAMHSQLLKVLVGGLVFVALAVGNGAYEAGNLAGAALGAEAVFGENTPDHRFVVFSIALIAAGLLFRGQYRLLEKMLVLLVLLMSIAFILSALIVRPDLSQLFAGFKPSIPDGAVLTAVALIGTTIVPYNLFLHAAATRERWQGPEGLRSARQDTVLSIGLGGLVSMLIVATAAATLFRSGLEVSNAADMAISLQSVFGDSARYLIGFGLLAAGLTSAITAPMATAYALSEILGGPAEKRQRVFRITALSVVTVGAAINLLGLKPISLILIAQFANGLLLPIIAIFLLLVMNRKDLLGENANGVASNLAGVVVVTVTLALGLRAILSASGVSF